MTNFFPLSEIFNCTRKYHFKLSYYKLVTQKLRKNNAYNTVSHGDRIRISRNHQKKPPSTVKRNIFTTSFRKEIENRSKYIKNVISISKQKHKKIATNQLKVTKVIKAKEKQTEEKRKITRVPRNPRVVLLFNCGFELSFCKDSRKFHYFASIIVFFNRL